MGISLYPHNAEAYDALISLLSKTGKACVIHPTGTGKSFIAFKYCEDHPEQQVLWFSPSEYIFKTQCENLAATGAVIPQNITFYTYQKLCKMTLEELEAIHGDALVLDEYHRSAARKWFQAVRVLLDRNQTASLIGLTATPIRYLDDCMDTSELLFESNVASEISLGEAIARGILPAPKYVISVISFQQELDRYQKKLQKLNNKEQYLRAESILEQLRREIANAEGIEETFEKHLADRTGKYLVFCANREHMLEVKGKARGWLKRIDQKAHFYTAFSDDPETSKEFAAFKADASEHLKLLFCVNMLNEGVHVDDISGVILFRPTVSPIIYKQQIGRALSSGKNGTPLVLDIVANVYNLYSVDGLREEMREAVWYYKHENQEKKITHESFEVLDEVADVRKLFRQLDDTLSLPWERYYAAALEYAKTQDINRIRQDYTLPSGVQLGQWIQRQKKQMRAKNLTDEQMEKLGQLGLNPTPVKDLAWMDMYESLKNVYQKNGSCDIPNSYVDDENRPLGRWCQTMRSAYAEGKYVAPYKTELLKAIGFRFENNAAELAWDAAYSLLLDYVNQTHSLSIPRSYSVPGAHKINLSLWLKNQKSMEAQGKLREDRKEKLEKLGVVFEFNASEQKWMDAYKIAADYYHQHGNLDTGNPCIVDSFDLGYWLYSQRKNKKCLGSEKIALLNQIGMGWETKLEQLWNNGYKHLLLFREQFHHADVKLKYRSPDGFSLGQWCERQRKSCQNGNLSEEQIEKLERVGFPLAQKERQKEPQLSWKERYEIVRDYLASHPGDVDPVAEVKDVRIYQWIKHQQGKLRNGQVADPEEYRLLMDLRILDIQKKNTHWETMYQAAVHYFTEQGNTTPPEGFLVQGTKLRSWLAREQKIVDGYFRSERTAEQIEKLKKIGITKQTHNFHEERWNQKFERASEFVHQNGRLPKSTENRPCFRWIDDQKRKYQNGKLSHNQAESLRGIGVELGNQAARI